MKSHNKLLCKSRCFLRASPLSPRGLVCLAEEARFGQAWLLPVSGPLPTQTNDEADSGSAPLRDRSRPWMCLQRKRQAVTLPRAIYKPFWMNWAILGLLSLAATSTPPISFPRVLSVFRTFPAFWLPLGCLCHLQQ